MHILATLDHYGVCDRSQGQKPFLLVDGHGSRFQPDFLQYVIDADHEWVVCIGVPYGTALWQVGDSSEQNGSYKMALARAKERLIAKKRSKFMKLTIDYTDVIPIVNYAWAHSFGRVTSNMKAIRDRGWNPLNRNLLLEPKLRSTMTEGDKQSEAAIIPSQYLPSSAAISPHGNPTTTTLIPSTTTALVPASTAIDPTSAALVPTSTTLIAAYSEPKEYLNYRGGTAAFCLDRIVQHNDLMESRERIKREYKDGKSIEKMIDEQKGAFSAGKAFSVGLVRIGKTVFDRVTKHTEEMKKAEQKRNEAARLVMADMVKKANEVKALGKEANALTIAQIKVLLAPLKRKGDKALPSKKVDLLARLREWEGRGPLPAEEESLTTAEAEPAESETERNENPADFGQVEMI